MLLEVLLAYLSAAEYQGGQDDNEEVDIAEERVAVLDEVHNADLAYRGALALAAVGRRVRDGGAFPVFSWVRSWL